MAISSVSNNLSISSAAVIAAQSDAKPAANESVRSQPVLPSSESEKSPEKSRAETDRQLQESVEQLQKFISQSNADITFSIDKDVGMMVKVIDRGSNDVIRQIPSEEVVEIARALDKLQGLFVRDKI